MSESLADSKHSNEISRKGLPRRLWDWFYFSEPFRPRPPARPGFLLEERIALIADLLSLRDQGDRSVETWAAQVADRLQREAQFASLAKRLQGNRRIAKARAGKTEDETSTDQHGDPTREPASAVVIEVIDAAMALAQRHPIAAFGADVRSLIAQEVEAAIQTSVPVRAVRWLAPLAVALLLGGTIYGGIHVQSLFTQIKDLQDTLNKKAQEVDEKSIAALTAFQTKLDGEVKPRIQNIVDAATSKYKLAADDEINRLPGFVAAEKARFLAEQNTQGSQALSNRRDAILDTLNDKRIGLETTIDQRRTAIEASIDAKEQAIAKAIAAKQAPIENSLGELNKAIGAQTIELARSMASFQQTLAGDLSSAPAQINELMLKIGQADDRLAGLQDAVRGLRTTAGDIHVLSAALAAQSGNNLTLSGYLAVLRWEVFAAAAFAAVSVLSMAILLTRGPQATDRRMTQASRSGSGAGAD